VKNHPEGNELLAALPQSSHARIFPLLREVDLPLGKEVYAAGQVENMVYFPIDCIVSLLYVMDDGHSAEIAVVGREGMMGIAMLLGGNSMPNCAIVQSAGSAYRLPSTDFKREFDRDPNVRMSVLRYLQALFTQMAQTAACNRHHSIEQQLCRWLLLSLDRLNGQELTMTQELIANMLGVRREGVTHAAGRLQKLGLIRYQRGHITVLDRAGLERRCCECYQVVKDEADRLAARHERLFEFTESADSAA
jgi:CRP-like cAMP-binding protein